MKQEEKKEQHQDIFDMHEESPDGWVCGNEYRKHYIFSAHKRRGEMSQEHKDFMKCYGRFNIVRFEDRKCEHGSRGVKDYIITLVGNALALYPVMRMPMDTAEMSARVKVINAMDSRKLAPKKEIKGLFSN